MANLPDAPRPDSRETALRRLSSQEFELVIRRAAELQARAAEEEAGGEGDGVSEAEALRIGRELGLSGRHLERALAEIRTRTPSEAGLLFRVYGAGTVAASRAVAGEAKAVHELLERHLTEREFLAVLRRFPDRTLFTRAQGVAAVVGRATRGFVSRRPLLSVKSLEVAVRPLEEGFSHVTLSTSLSGERIGAAVGGMVGGTTAGTTLGVALGIAVAPPAALVALPVLGGILYGSRAAYASVAGRAQLQLESLLDRLEHGEIVLPRGRGPGFLTFQDL